MGTEKQEQEAAFSPRAPKKFSEMTREDVMAWGRAMQAKRDAYKNSPEYKAKVAAMKAASNERSEELRRRSESGEPIPTWR